MPEAPAERSCEYERLGLSPTRDHGTRLTEQLPWDESTRPRRSPLGPDVSYTAPGRQVAQHHGLEDDAIFPHLASSDTTLTPVIDRLAAEHLVIHDAIEGVDRALVAHINDRDDFAPLQQALDLLTDTLLSHLSYEEHELVEPLARLGFYAGQL